MDRRTTHAVEGAYTEYVLYCVLEWITQDRLRQRGDNKAYTERGDDVMTSELERCYITQYSPKIR